MIFIAGITIAIFIEFLLISKKNKTFADKVLTAWMFLLAIHIFLFYILYTEDIYDYPFFLGIEMPLPLLHGPILYFYVAAMTNQLPKNKSVLSLHIIPTVVMFTYLSITYYSLPAEQEIYIFKNEGIGFETFIIIKDVAINCSGIIYVAWSVWLLRKHKRNILHQFSDLEKVELRWLQFLTWGLGLLWLVVIFSTGVYVFGVAVIFVFLIGFLGHKQGSVFVSNSPKVSTDHQKEKYAKSGLKEGHSDELYQKLTGLMDDGIYKNGEISIGELASELDVHPNYLSQVINERDEKNFYDFINGYRLEEFKRLIAIPKNQNLTLLAVAYDCGFNSKSSFNRYFKKAMNQTPSQYFASISHSQEA